MKSGKVGKNHEFNKQIQRKNDSSTTGHHIINFFFTGAIIGIVVCAALGHNATTPTSGIAADRDTSDQIETLERKVAQNANNADTWTQLGNMYFDSDGFEKAIAAYQHALSLNPNNPDVWTDLGIMYRRSGRPQKAVEAFDRAIAEDPNHENSRFNRGIVLFYDLDDRQGAIRCWEDLLEINPLAMASNDQPLDQWIQPYRNDESKNG